MHGILTYPNHRRLRQCWAALPAVAFAALMTVPVSARAQGRLEGTVRNGAGPITTMMSGQVRLSDGQRAFVDSLGHFHFDSVRTGRVKVTIRALMSAPESATVVIRPGRTTRQDFLIHVDSFWVIKHEAKWLGCRAVPPGVNCIPPRGILPAPWGFRTGAWLFRDSTALSQFFQQHARQSALASVRLLSTTDWSRDNVVAVSYGSYSGCGPRTYVNRIELRADTTVIVVGEDSLYEGPPQITCMAIVSSADFVIVPRPRGMVIVRPANPGSRLQPLRVEELSPAAKP